MRNAWSLLASGSFVLLVSAQASAFCRTTTCRTTAAHECTTDDDGCVSEGAPLIWPSRCVGFSFQAQGSAKLVPEDTKVAIEGAFASWSEHECPAGGTASIAFSPTDDVQCKLPQANKDGPNVNVVFFRDDAWPYKGVDGTLATTTVTYDADGTIWDADIAINAAFNDVTLSDTDVEYDVPSIVVHEAGHFIGLAHSPDDEALMAPTYSPGQVRRDLRDDDIDALCTAYPPDRQATCSLAPRGGFSARCTDTTTETAAPAKDGGCSVAAPGAATQSMLAAVCSSVMLGILALRRRRVFSGSSSGSSRGAS